MNEAESYWTPISGSDVMRLRVPGGYLYRARNSDRLTFTPDPIPNLLTDAASAAISSAAKHLPSLVLLAIAKLERPSNTLTASARDDLEKILSYLPRAVAPLHEIALRILKRLS